MYLHPEEVPSAIKRYQDEILRVLTVLETHLQNREWCVPRIRMLVFQRTHLQKLILFNETGSLGSNVLSQTSRCCLTISSTLHAFCPKASPSRIDIPLFGHGNAACVHGHPSQRQSRNVRFKCASSLTLSRFSEMREHAWNRSCQT